MLTQSRPPPSSSERSWPDKVDKHTAPWTPSNDRAIELSEKGHIELVLYARGLEVERDRLRENIRSAMESLATLTKTTEMSPRQHEAIAQVASILAKCL